MHLTAYLLWPLSILHSLLLGTPDQPLLLGTTIVCAAVGLGATISQTSDDTRRAAIASQEWS